MLIREVQWYFPLCFSQVLYQIKTLQKRVVFLNCYQILFNVESYRVVSHDRQGIPYRKRDWGSWTKIKYFPPFASCSAQMEATEMTETIKIAKHWVHFKSVITRIKQFKILYGKISLTFFWHHWSNLVNLLFIV